MRQKIAAGNWKMNLTLDEGLQLARSISNYMNPEEDTLVLLAAPYVYLKSLSDLTFPIKNLVIAAQNCHEKEKGAHTGEISIPMLQSINIDYVIIGHSERRMNNHENDELLKSKVDALISSGLNVIFCCGEPLQIREEGWQNKYVAQQLENSLFHLDEEAFNKVIIAYEPIWAIGTGKTASPDQAQEMHGFIRNRIGDKYNQQIAESTSILYGGSVNGGNAKELFSKSDVDGGLVGGASLSSEEFIKIMDALGHN